MDSTNRTHLTVVPDPEADQNQHHDPVEPLPTEFTSPELAAPCSEVKLSRRQLMFGAALCTGGLLLSRTPANADIVDTLNKFLNLDDTVLNYAHEMEELEMDFFIRATASKGYSQLDGREQSVFSLIANQDKAHFDALGMVRQKRQVRGSITGDDSNRSASERPRFFHYPRGVFDSREALLQEAVDLKQNVLYAYHGAVDLVRDNSLLGPAAAIAGVESRHLVVLREIAGLDPVPTSFEGQVSPQKIGDRLGKRYGFLGGNERGGAVR